MYEYLMILYRVLYPSIRLGAEDMRIIEDTPFSCRQNDGGATLSLPGAFPRAAPSHCLRCADAHHSWGLH